MSDDTQTISLEIEKGFSKLVGMPFYCLKQNGAPIAFSLFEDHLTLIKEAIENGTVRS